MKTFEILGRYRATPPAADWRDQLAARLGYRPRRIGVWSELALFGALECMSDAGEQSLPAHATLLVASQFGPAVAMQEAYSQSRDGLPMPLTFLQTQPSQMLATLAAHLGWSGDASFAFNPQPAAMLRLATARCGAQGVLMGWVDEGGAGATAWLRLRPVERAIHTSRAAQAEDLFSPQATHFHLDPEVFEILTA
jgi:hypothetical protein